MTHFDASNEILITPFQAGIKLLRPSTIHCTMNLPRLGQALRSACNIYATDLEHKVTVANETMVNFLGFESNQPVLSRPVCDLLSQDTASAHSVVQNNNAVLNKHSTLITEEQCIHDDGQIDNFLTVKVPIYHEDGNILGVFGGSVLLGQQPLAESIALFSQIGLLNSSSSSQVKETFQYSNIDDAFFTKRQAEIIHYILRGRSANQIAIQIGLSKRTVEHYIEAIKHKLKVDTKAQLIDKVLYFSQH